MSNKIQIENALPGTTNWQLDNPIPFVARDSKNFSTSALEGYASLTSVNVGEDIKFYVRTYFDKFSMEFYRVGYYGGAGGHLKKTVVDLPGNKQSVPKPKDTTDYGLVECDWTVSYVLTVPSDWVSGVYLVKLIAGGFQSYIIFVVREDARTSDVLMQCSVTTYQAYNGWGGRSIYACYSDGRLDTCTKVSFNRPYFAPHRGYADENNPEMTQNAKGSGQLLASFPFGTYEPAWEYNMIRWLEKQGYDVMYCTNIDVHRDPKLLLSHRLFMSVGHDEYWTRDMRVNVEMARDQGVDLMFCCGNSVYRQARLESDAHGNPHRTLVCHKPRSATPVPDPLAQKILDNLASDDDLYPYPNVTGEFITETRYGVTVAWPESSLTGSTWVEEAPDYEELEVVAASDWIYSGSGAAAGLKMPHLAGYEVDGDKYNSVLYAPSNRRILATSPSGGKVLAYTVEGGTTVFSSGSMEWSWGLDDWKIPNCHWGRPSALNSVVAQMTTNLLARAVRTTGAEAAICSTSGTGTITQTGFDSGLPVRWRIIPGSFSTAGSTDALVYDPTTGDLQFYTVGKDCSLTPIGSPRSGERKSWCIIPGTFHTGGTLTDLLFYDRASGEVQFYRTDGTGALIPIGPLLTGWRRTLQIIPGRFGSKGTTSTTSDLLLYNPARGEVQFVSTDGLGGIAPIGSKSSGWRRTWQIIPGKFGSATGRTDLLLYDPALGEALFCSTNGTGGITELGTAQSGWRRTWKIIPGTFGSTSGRTDLLFYDQTTGEAQFCASDGLGGVTNIGAPISGWRKTWQIFPLLFSGDSRTSLLFFDSFAVVP